MPELKTVEASRAIPGVGQISAIADAVPALRAITTHPERTQAAMHWHTAILATSVRYRTNIWEMLAEEADHGRFLLFSPLFMGAGAILWFEMDADVSLFRLSVWLLALAAVFMVAGRARVVMRATILAGGLCVAGMFCAQFETWRAGTIMLDSPVTTTVTGRVERREVGGPGRWRYTIAVERTELPEVKRPPERISLVARGMTQPFEIGQWLTAGRDCRRLQVRLSQL